MARHRRPIEVFSMSFLDCMSCGFGAVILFFMIINAQVVHDVEETPEQRQGETTRLQYEILEQRKNMVLAKNSMERLKDEEIRAKDQIQQIIALIEKLKAELEKNDKDTLAKIKRIEIEEIAMKRKWILAATVAPLLLLTPWPAQAFECPVHFAAAQLAIDMAAESIKRMKGGMPIAARSHLRHARMSLNEADYHHTQTGNFHHARAIVRANEARGHAITAEILSREIAKR